MPRNMIIFPRIVFFFCSSEDYFPPRGETSLLWRTLAWNTLGTRASCPRRGLEALVPSVFPTRKRSVKQWRGFRPDAVAALAIEAGIPEADHDHVVEYVGKQIRGLHEGNLIRYRLRPEDLAALEEG